MISYIALPAAKRRRGNPNWGKPHVVQNHGASYHPTFITTKIFQQAKFLRSQLQQVVTPPRFSPHQVQLQVSRLQTHGLTLGSRGSAQ